ncbi:hypothetical protein ACJ72_02758 [Emergomyces africanus]|uniref:JmjC domain-containing protein n=1 Tax=Emergomyces africanus TaxID=1955775 RepID=A0A1B7P1J3_9EURO|nr:hypothetical protein ACJ72_02758 [Emergomyces africanus]
MKRSVLPSSTRGMINPSSLFRQLDTLPSHDIAAFRASYFQPQLPVILPRGQFDHLPAIQKWFSAPSSSTSGSSALPSTNSLNYAYLEKYNSCSVPLEITSSHDPASPKTATFQRLHAPLDLFLRWTKTTTSLDAAAAADDDDDDDERNPLSMRLYVAQCQLLDLPPALRADFPTPSLVSETGKGDVYDTNIWMGIPPTYTPLHRDPNPNLFVQMAGRKIVRLYAPDSGLAVFQRVRETILLRQQQQQQEEEEEEVNVNRIVVGDAKFRGEEMMQGLEKELLEKAVWGDGTEGRLYGECKGGNGGIMEGFEAHLNAGDGMFIPMGWWHSIIGVGKGITASVRFSPFPLRLSTAVNIHDLYSQRYLYKLLQSADCYPN